MRIKMHWALALPLLMWSCEKEELDKTIDLGEFSLGVPSDWTSFPGQGYDSQTGRITDGKDELTYDHGWYSYDFRKETATTHTRTATTIDGKPALIVQPKNRGKGIIGVFIQVNPQTKFNLYGQDIKDERVVLRIFKSVKFSQ